jgi:hypothetical protein
MAAVAPWLGGLIGIVLIGLGVLFWMAPHRAFAVSGHVPSALPAVMAGRYGAFGAVVIAFVVMAEWRALMVVLAVGAAMGALDAVIAARSGGSVAPHLGAGVGSALGAVASWARMGL